MNKMTEQTLEEFMNSSGIKEIRERTKDGRETMFAMDINSDTQKVTLLEIDCTEAISRGIAISTGPGVLKGGIPIYKFKVYELAHDIFTRAKRIEDRLNNPSLSPKERENLSTHLSVLNETMDSLANGSYNFVKRTLRDSY